MLHRLCWEDAHPQRRKINKPSFTIGPEPMREWWFWKVLRTHPHPPSTVESTSQSTVEMGVVLTNLSTMGPLHCSTRL